MSDQKKKRGIENGIPGKTAGPTEIPDSALEGVDGGAEIGITEDSLTNVDPSFARTGQLSSSSDKSRVTPVKEGVFPLTTPGTRG